MLGTQNGQGFQAIWLRTARLFRPFRRRAWWWRGWRSGPLRRGWLGAQHGVFATLVEIVEHGCGWQGDKQESEKQAHVCLPRGLLAKRFRRVICTGLLCKRNAASNQFNRKINVSKPSLTRQAG